MNGYLTIREASSLMGCPRKTLFYLLIRKQLSYAQLEPDGPFLVPAAEVEEVALRGLAYAREWAERHPGPERIDLLTDWSTWKETERV